MSLWILTQSLFLLTLASFRLVAASEKRILLSDPNYVIHIESSLSELTAKVLDLESKNTALLNSMDDIDSKLPKTGSGAMYTRWGRTTCPGDGTELVYSGVAAGSLYTDTGGAVEYVCMPNNPTFEHMDYTDNDAHLYGAEYQVTMFTNSTSTGDRVPCAVCHSTNRASYLLLPGNNKCISGWTMEYHGILSSGNRNHKAGSQYICLDAAAESLKPFHSFDVGKLLYRVRSKCGSLPCPPFVDGNILSCAVCTK